MKELTEEDIKKLEPHQDALVQMEALGCKPAEMQEWLKTENVEMNLVLIVQYVDSLRLQRAQALALEKIVAGAKFCDRLDQAFAEHPEPPQETLIKLFKSVIMDLATKGATEPKFLVMADKLTRTCIAFIKSQSQVRFKEIEISHAERKLKLIEEKAQAFDEAKEVSARRLTPAEREAEYRRIFGMSA